MCFITSQLHRKQKAIQLIIFNKEISILMQHRHEYGSKCYDGQKSPFILI